MQSLVIATLLTTGAINNNTNGVTASVTIPKNNLGILTVIDDGPNAPSSISASGLTFYLIKTKVSSNGLKISMYSCMPTSDFSGAITITFGSNTNIYWTLTSFQNADLSGIGGQNAILQAVGGEGNGSSNGGNNGLSIALSAFKDPRNATHGVVLGQTNLTSITKGTNFTELDQQTLLTGVGGATSQLESEFANNNQTTVPWTWTTTNSGNDSTHDVGMAVEIKAVSLFTGGGII